MKQLFLYLIVFFSLSTYAQHLPESEILRGAKLDIAKDKNSKSDSLGYDKIKPMIKTWRLIDNFSRIDSVALDTLLIDVNNFNPIFKKSISNAYLGNLGSPYQSNIFFEREYEENVTFLKPLRIYINKPEDMVFFNTKTPYSSILYTHSGSKQESEDVLKLMHSQNVNEFWNIGMSYNLITSEGLYSHQKNKLYDFSFFTSYSKKRYSFNAMISNNNLLLNDNGGIENVDELDEKGLRTRNISVNLSDTKNKIKNFNFFNTHKYGIGNYKEIINNKDTSNVYPMYIVYTMNYESDSRKFIEDFKESNYYKNSYFDTTVSFDQEEYSVFKNSAQLLFEENENKWIRLGARFQFSNEIINYKSRLKNNNIYKYTSNDYHNNEILANVYSKTGHFISWDAKASFVFEGYRSGNINLKANLIKWIDKKTNHGLRISGGMVSESPSFFSNEYNGNHQVWKNNFDSQVRSNFGFEYFNDKYKLKIGARVDRIDSYIYFDAEALVKQYDDELTVFTAFLDKNIRLGNFHLNQRLVLQNSSSEEILPLPKLTLYSNNYYSNTFFKDALDVQIGFSVRYNTSYFAPSYMASIAQFHLQEETKLGNYPLVDVFFNFRMGRTKFFVKYEHMNSFFGKKNYFNTLHYPLNPAALKYGLVWTFYN